MSLRDQLEHGVILDLFVNCSLFRGLTQANCNYSALSGRHSDGIPFATRGRK